MSIVNEVRAICTQRAEDTEEKYRVRPTPMLLTVYEEIDYEVIIKGCTRYTTLGSLISVLVKGMGNFIREQWVYVASTHKQQAAWNGCQPIIWLP